MATSCQSVKDSGEEGDGKEGDQMARLPVGIIGLGRMGQIYARHLARASGAQIAGVSDVVADRAKVLASE